MQPNTFPPQIDGSSRSTLTVWFLLNIGQKYNKTDIRKVIYCFANEVINMADEESKNNDVKLMEG